MTNRKNNALKEEMKALFAQDTDFMKDLLQQSIQKIIDSEMVECLRANTHERSQDRKGYRSGFYSRNLITRIGKIELRVPRDREGELQVKPVKGEYLR